MTERALVAVDGSDSATAALEHAARLAADRGATVHVVHAVDTTGTAIDESDSEVLEEFDESGTTLLEDAVDRAERVGAATERALLRGDPAAAILDYAADRDIDPIAVGTRGRSGLRRLFLGSVAEAVIRRADAPVLTVREAAADSSTHPYDRVLVPTDGSAHARAAVERAVDLATRIGATVHVLSVVDATNPGFDVRPDRTRKRLESNAREYTSGAATVARDAGAPDVVVDVRTGVVSGEITDYAAANDVDLVVLGTRGRDGVGRAVLGSVAERVVRSAPVPVMTVGRSRSKESGR